MQGWATPAALRGYQQLVATLGTGEEPGVPGPPSLMQQDLAQVRLLPWPWLKSLQKDRRSIWALLGCLVRVLLWVASALLYFGSEQAARLLGSPCLRRLYHAWLAAVVIFGPLLQFHVNPRTIFASHGNFFNM